MSKILNAFYAFNLMIWSLFLICCFFNSFLPVFYVFVVSSLPNWRLKTCFLGVPRQNEKTCLWYQACPTGVQKSKKQYQYIENPDFFIFLLFCLFLFVCKIKVVQFRLYNSGCITWLSRVDFFNLLIISGFWCLLWNMLYNLVVPGGFFHCLVLFVGYLSSVCRLSYSFTVW